MSECRVCAAGLETFLDFGRMPLADRFVEPGGHGDEYFYDLAVGLCPRCGMVQLVDVPAPGVVFPPDYPYRSSGSAGMRAHFAEFATRLVASAGNDPFVVEIGSNDGAMLHVLAAAGLRHLGVEPAAGAARVAAERGVEVLCEFFTPDVARRIRASHGPADVVYAANTMCHIADIHGAFEAVTLLLDDGGVLVFEDPYLGDIVDASAFDQIYDEHVFYFSLSAVTELAARHGLEVVDVERLPVHGGELRYTVARAGRRGVRAAVGDLLATERARGSFSAASMHEFASAAGRIRDDLAALLERRRRAGRRVVGYGATAKSATVINWCGITTDLVEFVCDSTPEKQGKLTPGAHLPVRPPTAFCEPYPDEALLFAWNHAPEIMRREAGFTAAGGRWILYVPEVRVVGG
jgi:methylation protein EvaC